MLQGHYTSGQHVPHHIITITYNYTSVINISWLKDHWPYIIHCMPKRKTEEEKKLVHVITGYICLNYCIMDRKKQICLHRDFWQ